MTVSFVEEVVRRMFEKFGFMFGYQDMRCVFGLKQFVVSDRRLDWALV